MLVYRQHWVESEAGWGVRPDGYSYHRTASDRDRFIKDYWDTLPDEVPDEYSRPHGQPQRVRVSEDLYKSVLKSAYGIRCS